MSRALVLTAARAVIAGIYLVSGAEKLFQPYQNFVYVVQGYDMLHDPALERAAAWGFPWAEYLLGGLLLAGLWTRFALRGIAVFSGVFIFAVGQALARGLPLDECGCFGDLVGMPLEATLAVDAAVLAGAMLLLRFFDAGTARWSLDAYCGKGRT